MLLLQSQYCLKISILKLCLPNIASNSFFVSSNIQRPNKNVCRPGYSDDDAGVAEGHDQNRENPGEGEEVEEVCQLLEYPQRRGGG